MENKAVEICNLGVEEYNNGNIQKYHNSNKAKNAINNKQIHRTIK